METANLNTIQEILIRESNLDTICSLKKRLVQERTAKISYLDYSKSKKRLFVSWASHEDDTYCLLNVSFEEFLQFFYTESRGRLLNQLFQLKNALRVI